MRPATTTMAKWFLGVAANAGSHSGGSRPRQATSAVIMMGRRRRQRSFASGFANRAAFEAEFIDVAD